MFIVNIFPYHLKPYLYWLLFYACMSYCLSGPGVILIFLWISNICIFSKIFPSTFSPALSLKYVAEIEKVFLSPSPAMVFAGMENS